MRRREKEPTERGEMKEVRKRRKKNREKFWLSKPLEVFSYSLSLSLGKKSLSAFPFSTPTGLERKGFFSLSLSLSHSLSSRCSRRRCPRGHSHRSAVPPRPPLHVRPPLPPSSVVVVPLLLLRRRRRRHQRRRRDLLDIDDTSKRAPLVPPPSSFARRAATTRTRKMTCQ